MAFFLDGSTTPAAVATLAGRAAAFITSTLTAGSHTVSVEYAGDANYTASSGSVKVKVK